MMELYQKLKFTKQFCTIYVYFQIPIGALILCKYSSERANQWHNGIQGTEVEFPPPMAHIGAIHKRRHQSRGRGFAKNKR